MITIKPKQIFLKLLKFALFVVCIYSVTRFGENPNQRECCHMYSGLYYLYFTFQNVYLAIFTAILGFIYRNSGEKSKKTVFSAYNTVLPVSIVLSFGVTIVFWSLFFYNKKLIIFWKYTEPGYETYMLTELGQHLFPLLLLLLEQIDIKITQTPYQVYFMMLYLIAYGIAIKIFEMNLGKYIYPGLKFIGNNSFFGASFLFAIMMIYYMIYRLFISLKTKRRWRLRLTLPHLELPSLAEV